MEGDVWEGVFTFLEFKISDLVHTFGENFEVLFIAGVGCKNITVKRRRLFLALQSTGGRAPPPSYASAYVVLRSH